jgi:hypothetical protein
MLRKSGYSSCTQPTILVLLFVASRKCLDVSLQRVFMSLRLWHSAFTKITSFVGKKSRLTPFLVCNHTFLFILRPLNPCELKQHVPSKRRKPLNDAASPSGDRNPGITLFWVMTPCRLVSGYQCCGAHNSAISH